MTEGTRVAAFSGGELHMLADGARGREVVLALPLSSLLVKLVRVPAEQDAVAVATPVLKRMSPFPDEPLDVSCELVSSAEDGSSVVLAAALPEGATDDLAEALDAAKASVVRVDALALGAVRAIWSELPAAATAPTARTLVVLREPECLTLLVLDGDLPVSIRAIASSEDLEREKTISLLEAEDFNGPRELSATVDRDLDVDAALEGVRARSDDETSFNAIPASWREVLGETRFKAKLVRNLAVAGALWLLVLGVLFGVPVAYGFMTDHVKGLSRAHQRQFRAVQEKKEKTLLVRKYSDHTRGALEIMKGVSDRLPEGVKITSWTFARDDGVRVRGEAGEKNEIYALKDSLVAMAGEGGDEPVFRVVRLGGVSSQKDGVQKFDLECHYEEAEE